MEVDERLDARLVEVFQPPLASVLAERGGRYRVRLAPGRTPDEIVVALHPEGRSRPLPLYFPKARSLDAGDVARILRNVLEGLGRAFQ